MSTWTSENISGELWLTSDWHFQHKNMLENFGTRPEDYETRLIEDYCSKVKENDTVIFLGDMLFQPFTTKKWFSHLINTLPGFKYLLRGNHDDKKRFPDPYWYEECGFTYVFNYNRVAMKINEHKILLSHFPIINTNPEDSRYEETTAELLKVFNDEKFDINIHGHTHSHIVGDTRCTSVCPEITNYKLINIKNLLN